jgi:hypothetical protein
LYPFGAGLIFQIVLGINLGILSERRQRVTGQTQGKAKGSAEVLFACGFHGFVS